MDQTLGVDAIERAFNHLQAMTVANATAAENKRVCQNAFKWALQGAIVAETIKGKNDDEREMRGALAFPELYADMVKAQKLAAAAETDLALAKIDVDRIKTQLDAGKFVLALTESSTIKTIYALARSYAADMLAAEKAREQAAEAEPTVAYEFQVADGPQHAAATVDCSEVEIPF